MESYKGKVLLIVNVASKCGHTPQYAGLEALQRKYKDQGFTVLGVPCNQFGGQEPGTNDEIKQFCSSKYDVSFPILDKADVNGTGRHPLYKVLAGKDSPYAGDIKWNFTKFLVDRSGKVVKRFGPKTTPEEIATKMEIPLDKVRKVLKIAKEPISLETPVGEEEDSHLGDFIEDKKIMSPSEATISMDLAEQTRKILATLTPREEKVLRMRFGISERADYSPEESRESLEISRERARQIESGAVRKLRNPSRRRMLKAPGK